MSIEGVQLGGTVRDRGGLRAQRSSGFERAPVAAGAFGGGVLTVVGSLLPWLSVYAGLKTYRGIAGLNGRLLLVGGAIGVLLALWYLWRGGAVLRWTMGVLGAMLLGFCAWLVVQLLALYRDVGGNPFVVGRLGPGLFVSTLGAAVLLATLLLPAGTTRSGTLAATLSESSPNLVRGSLALLSGSAAVIHFGVLGEHVREYWLFGIFFALAGVFQMAWALLALTVPAPRFFLLGGAGNAIIVLIWGVSRTIGLPVGAEAETPEPVGFADTVATVYEALVVIGACVLLRRPWIRSVPLGRFAGPAAWTLALVLVPLTILALLSAVHATSVVPHQ